jgi:hypothetical protein
MIIFICILVGILLGFLLALLVNSLGNKWGTWELIEEDKDMIGVVQKLVGLT